MKRKQKEFAYILKFILSKIYQRKLLCDSFIYAIFRWVHKAIISTIITKLWLPLGNLRQ